MAIHLRILETSGGSLSLSLSLSLIPLMVSLIHQVAFLSCMDDASSSIALVAAKSCASVSGKSAVDLGICYAGSQAFSFLFHSDRFYLLVIHEASASFYMSPNKIK